MEIDKLILGRHYQSGLKVHVDWVAGGNYNGYIFKTGLNFFLENNLVIKTNLIIDKSQYDDPIESTETYGNYYESDKSTITCVFDQLEMRGKILGESNQFLVFSCHYRNNTSWTITECYELS